MSGSINSGDVVFTRKKKINPKEQEDIWDDTALIEAYDKAVSLAYDAAHASLENDSDIDLSKVRVKNFAARDTSAKTNKSNNHFSKWNVGDSCLCKYEKDNGWYEATVVSVDQLKNKFSVKFEDYDESEYEVDPSHMRKLPKPSSQIHENTSETESSIDVAHSSTNLNVETSATKSNKNKKKEVPKNFKKIFKPTFLPPPPPPTFLHQSSSNSPTADENEAMASMLMSWYMSGYHTGYYQALRDLKKQDST